jgi:hypothetical protein
MKKEYEELIQSLAKKESPIVARMRRRFQKEAGFSAKKRKQLQKLTKQPSQAQKSEEVLNFEEPLAKNEYQMTQYLDGTFKMEFGPEVPEKVKKRAKEWAARKGLKVSEIGLEKNENGFERIIYKKQ